jgi:hypothetical protein
MGILRFYKYKIVEVYMKNIETRLDKIEDALKSEALTLRQYSPEEKRLYQECARRQARIELDELHNGVVRTKEEREKLLNLMVREVAKEMNLEHLLKF